MLAHVLLVDLELMRRDQCSAPIQSDPAAKVEDHRCLVSCINRQMPMADVSVCVPIAFWQCLSNHLGMTGIRPNHLGGDPMELEA